MLTALLVHAEGGAEEEIRAALLEAGCGEVWVARTVEDAFSLGRRYAVDLIVIDLAAVPARTDLRKMSRRLRGAPAIALAAAESLELAFETGAVDCLVHPLRPTELVARARAALRLRAERTRRTNRERKLSEEIRRLERENVDLERMVCVDSLTGLANRRHALALLAAEWKRSAREGTPMSVVMIDLDCFHAFNERYGHLGGDDCLRKVTEEMVRCLRRPSDFLGRYGGEEFIAVLPNTDPVGARIVAERLRTSVEALGIPHQTSACSRVVTISAGFASATAKPDRAVEHLISAADCALLRAKSFGRNGVTGEAPAVPARAPVSSHPWTRFPVVVADPWFVDRIPQFLAEVGDDAREVEKARQANELERIRMIARRLKTNAREYGLDQIRHLAHLIENAARFGDLDQVLEATQELAEYVTHVQVIYRRPLEQQAS